MMKCGLNKAVKSTMLFVSAIILLCITALLGGFSGININTSVVAATNAVTVIKMTGLSEKTMNSEKYLTFEISLSEPFTSSAVNDIQNDRDYEDALNFVELNGKKLKDLVVNGVDKWGNTFRAGTCSVKIDCNASGNLVLYFHKYLAEDCSFKRDSNDVLIFKKGFSVEGGATVAENIIYRLERNEWIKCEDLSQYNYVTITLGKPSPFYEVGNVVNGRKTLELFLTFSGAASYKSLNCVGSRRNYLQADAVKALTNYDNEKIEKLTSLGICHSVMTKIIIDGKSIAEILDSESGYYVDTGLTVNYPGSGYNASSLELLFNAGASFYPNPDEDHTLTVKSGFVTPLFGRIEHDQTYFYSAETKTWMKLEELTFMENEKVDIQERDYSDTGEKSNGCSGSLPGVLPGVTLLGAVVVVLVKIIRRENSNEEVK